MLKKLRIYKSYASLSVLPILSSLLITPLVHAISAYDNVVVTTNAAIIKNGDVINDISDDWNAIIANCDNWYEDSVYAKGCTAFNADLATAYNNGTGWAVGVKEVKSPFSTGASGAMDIGDKIVQVSVNTGTDNYGVFSGAGTSSRLNLSSAGFTQTCSVFIYYQVNYNSRTGQAANPARPQVVGMSCENSNSVFNGIAQSHTETLYNSYVFFFNSPINYPRPDYEGIELTLADNDGDGLDIAKEAAQGTSDNNKDTDGDGLSDYIESRWYLIRNNIFCGSQCAYPNPTQKDLYTEIDWMKEPGINGRSFQPTSTQINTVINTYSAKGINAHFDTGQYGGGNELPSYTSSLHFVPDPNNTDFYDYKNGNGSITANFNPSRNKVWHYVISGYKYEEYPDSSGVSYTGDDDSFISAGLIKDSQSGFGYLNFDTALSGTLIHELGHSLCLSSEEKYTNQPQQCIYSDIDSSSAATTYLSSMNYSYQMFMVDYSSGQNTPNDHDDWGAVASGIKDFADPNRNSGDSLEHGRSAKEKKVKKGISITQAQELRKKGKLGEKNVNLFNSTVR